MTNREQELLIGWTVDSCQGDFSEESVKQAVLNINSRLSEPLTEPQQLEVAAAVIGLDVSINLFVYGTFMVEALYEKVVDHPITREIDSLADFERVDVGDDYDTLIPRNGSIVPGYRILASAADLAKTDRWEKDYVRKPVILRSGYEADAYFLRDGAQIP